MRAAFVDASGRREGGYDASCRLETLDLGVDGRPFGGRSFRWSRKCCTLHPCSAGVIGVLCITTSVLPLGLSHGRPLQLRDKVVGWRTCGFELPDIIANRDAVVGKFVEKARNSLRLGADVILPMGITQCPSISSRTG